MTEEVAVQHQGGLIAAWSLLVEEDFDFRSKLISGFPNIHPLVCSPEIGWISDKHALYITKYNSQQTEDEILQNHSIINYLIKSMSVASLAFVKYIKAKNLTKH